jgi:dolichyl-phosphate beta-glucosyltransferase
VPKTLIVVPCYNEAQRLRESEFLPLLARPEVELLFVDDGSTDGTAALLEAISERAGPCVHVLRIAKNGGKAEAVRCGMREAFALGAGIVGYMDADASTPAREILRLLAALLEREVDVVLGARIKLLGSNVRRQRARHYLGRLFATVASLALDLSVYDTQCGAKLFRESETLRAALSTPFSSRWVFDVELIGRLLVGFGGTPPIAASRFVELPLAEWSDVAGSKLSPSDMLRSGLELLKIGQNLQRARRRAKR